ncbi:MAG: nuclear transport factor 2 family protein [Chloroflexia bacterium]|nr:nuclear transport factor 2 family protein [Chloroflexia bacterium]
MSAEELVRTFCDTVVNDRRLELIDELFAADCCLHGNLSTMRAGSREEFKQLVIQLCADLPHLHVTLDRLIVNRGQEVDAIWTIHTDGYRAAPHTGEIVGATVFLIEDGRIRGAWADWRTALPVA